MRKKIFNYMKWKMAQAAPPPPPPSPPPPSMGAAPAPSASRFGDIRSSDVGKSNSNTAGNKDHIKKLNGIFQNLLVANSGDVDLSLQMACQQDGRGVVPESVDVALSGPGAPYIRSIKGLDLGPNPAGAPAGQLPPPPPM